MTRPFDCSYRHFLPRRALALPVFFALALLLGPSAALTHAQNDPAATVDACMRSEMSSRNIHGAQIAVMRDGEMVFERAYGIKHRERPDPVNINTQFRVGSTTKALTAFAILQQVDEGTIELDAPITRYLEDFSLAEPGQAEAITVWNLLTHTSGLHDTSAMEEADIFGPKDPGAMRRWVDKQIGSAPYAPPSRFWNYSSANYMYAGQILERVTSMSYPDYMDQKVFAPAGMEDTTQHAAQGVLRGNFAYGHYTNPFNGKREIFTLDDANNWARHPTGYANASAGDLVRFATLVMAGGGDLLSAESTEAMQTRQQHRDLREDQYYGLGTFVEFNNGREMVHHDGGAWGWTATLKWIPEAGVAVATVTNIATALMQNSTQCALSAYVSPVSRPNPPCELDRDRWDDFVGTYEGSINSGAPRRYEVTRPSPTGNLRFEVHTEGQAPRGSSMQQDCRLWLSDGPGTFNVPDLNTRLTFIEDPVEPGVFWMRNRFQVGQKRPPVVETPTIYLPRLNGPR